MFDPVAGDPVAVRAAGEEYARVAARIEAAAADLRAIAAEMDGRAVAVGEVEARATRLADTIERAHGRYAAAGAALVTYADALGRAQELSSTAHGAAVAALRAQDEALASIAWWTRMADQAPDPVVRDRYLALVEDARAELRLTDVQLEAARTDLRVAVAQRDGAVSTACAAIRGAMGGDDLHDTIWQDLGGGTQEVGLSLWNGVDEVAAALALAAVALCWLPGVNGVLAAAATIAGVLLLARDSVNYATGNSSGREVGASALGVVTFAVGRFAQQAIRLSVASARGGRALQHSGLAEQWAGGRRGVDQDERGRRGSGGCCPCRRRCAPGCRARWRRCTAIGCSVAIDGAVRDRARHLERLSSRDRPGQSAWAVSAECEQSCGSTGGRRRQSGAGVRSGGREDVAGEQGGRGARRCRQRSGGRGLAGMPEGAGTPGWVALSGSVQVVETACGMAPVLTSVAMKDACSGTLPRLARVTEAP
ncbi:hypothetical protein [Cellulomonas xiejunii]|uniref:hypothetical protein n=1 Tax=Cellulomonas xiejunii TaxID=2968083 RepID=UPI001D0E5C75|nr:hypothetical protein [Cellulomonas xiejunii]MCC2315313.1 hypothetical protein [Cellulomonas xiejunii]